MAPNRVLGMFLVSLIFFCTSMFGSLENPDLGCRLTPVKKKVDENAKSDGCFDRIISWRKLLESEVGEYSSGSGGSLRRITFLYTLYLYIFFISLYSLSLPQS